MSTSLHPTPARPRAARNILTLLFLVGAVWTASPATASPPSNPPDAVAVTNLLDALAVKEKVPSTGYARSLFGPAWSDDVTVPGGHNGCDTRSDTLRNQLGNLALKPGTHGCIPISGTLADPYTGKAINFQRGQTSSAVVQIDHIVALANSWQTGAQMLSVQQRKNFANDPINLLAVDGPTNQEKGAGDAASWLPPNLAFRCDYVARQVAVKAKYQLWVTPPEKSAITRVLGACAEPLRDDYPVAHSANPIKNLPWPLLIAWAAAGVIVLALLWVVTKFLRSLGSRIFGALAAVTASALIKEGLHTWLISLIH